MIKIIAGDTSLRDEIKIGCHYHITPINIVYANIAILHMTLPAATITLLNTLRR